MIAVGLQFVASARDLCTPITRDAVNHMRGRPGVSLIYPGWIMNHRLLHFATNFQATSPFDRAEQVIRLNGLVAVKAHIIKDAFGHVALDGMDKAYRDYLHQVFCRLEDRFAESLWWTYGADHLTLLGNRARFPDSLQRTRSREVWKSTLALQLPSQRSAVSTSAFRAGGTSECSIGRFLVRCKVNRPPITSCCPKAEKPRQAQVSAIVRYCCPTTLRSRRNHDRFVDAPARAWSGFFHRMILESVKITASRRGALLLAYVTTDNPSCRALLGSGAAAFPTSYLIRQP